MGRRLVADDALQRARQLLSGAQRAVVLTGAGISTDSGIPDYRGPQGVWTRDPEAEKLATLQHYMASGDVRRRAWQQRLRSGVLDAAPNAGHRALVTLEHSGRLHTLVTQNIDGLHQLAGSSPERVVEIHGTVREVVCMACRDRGPMADTLSRLSAGEEDPPCRLCGGILKSATISFGQQLVAADLQRAEQAALDCDLLLAVGTSLAVYPIANMVPIAKRAGAAIVIMNGGPTEMDALADVLLRGAISDLLPALIA